MDVLRWILLGAAIAVILGIYAWGRRDLITRWWAGDRTDMNYHTAEGTDQGEIADELSRLRSLMEQDVSEVRVRHRDADEEVYEVEVSAPRTVTQTDQDVLLDSEPRREPPPAEKPVPEENFQNGVESVSRPRVIKTDPSHVSSEARSDEKPGMEVQAPDPKASPEASPEFVDIGYERSPENAPKVTIPEPETPETLEESPLVQRAAERMEQQDLALSPEEPLQAVSAAKEARPEVSEEITNKAAARRTTREDRPHRKLDAIIEDDLFEAASEEQRRSKSDRQADIPDHDPQTGGLTDIGTTLTDWGESVVSFCQRHLHSKKREAPIKSTPEHILVVHVMAHAGQSFRGKQIRTALQEAELTRGKTSLYERLPKNRATTTPILCVANMLEPGVLTDELLEQDTDSPGLTLFARLPGPVEGVDALEELLVTAQEIALRLGGEMRDQERNVLSKQTISLMYEQVVEHARQMRLALSRGR